MEIPPRKPIKQLRDLSLQDFQHQGPLPNAASLSRRDEQEPPTDFEKAMRQLYEARDRFARQIPLGGNDICYLADRAAVLAVFRQALEKIDPENCVGILFEATMKVKVVLGIRAAKPHAAVFMAGGMLLPPLEPQYAEPRIEYGEDRFGYRAAWRLKAWRDEGWPDKYPSKAIEKERSREGRLKKGAKGDVDLLRRMEKWDDKDWGDVVDGDARG